MSRIEKHLLLLFYIFNIAGFALTRSQSENQPVADDQARKIIDNATVTPQEQFLKTIVAATNDTETDERMEEEGEWVQHAPKEEIEEAKHLLDTFHFDVSSTKNPLIITSLILLITLSKSTLKLRYLREIPESVVLMFYGVLFAIILVQILGVDPGQLDQWTFFMVLLPAIVNDAGHSMHKKEFFQSLPKITLFAVVGTVIHALLLAITLYLLEFYFNFNPGFLHLFVFATLISAVDPVSVLSTFNELDVKKDLFTLIFGESLCNDAVTIVLYRTTINVIKNSDASDANLTVWGVVGDSSFQFSLVCFAGVAIGVVVTFLSVLAMKFMVGHQINQPVLQLFCPFFAYVAAETCHFSGILALVTCAAIMSFYMAANMCVEMEFATITVSKTAASISEAFIFFYLGVSLITAKFAFDLWFVFIVILCCTVYRFFVTCCLSSFYNIFVSKESAIPFKDQVIISHAGIRGAVCFALVTVIDERVIPAKPYFATTTLIVIFWTSIMQGCTIKFLMKWLKIEGDNGVKAKNGRAYTFISNLNNKYFKKWFTSKKGNYSPTDETFKHLCLPKAVSTALRIGERSQTDLTRHGEVSLEQVPPQQVSVGRPTICPYPLDLNPDDAPLSTGRRTPVARNASRYSRHFIYSASANDPEGNYMTAPVSATKRPTFDPNLLYNNQNTVSHPGDVEKARCVNRRHNSMGADSIELHNLTKTLEKKHSRTVLSGNKKFVVNPEDLISEERESPSTSNKKKATFEDDEFSKIDEAE